MIIKNRKVIIDTMDVLKEFISSDWKRETVSSELVRVHKDEMIEMMDEVIQIVNMARARFPWDKEEVKYLKELFEKDKSFTDIAFTLRRSKGAIIGRLIKGKCLPDDFHDYEGLKITRKSELNLIYGGK